MRGIIQDVRFGLRVLAKNPAFTVVAVLSLALGIGANTTIFTFANAFLLRPIPVQDPEGLVSLFTTRTGGGRYGNTSYPDFTDLRARTDVFSGVVGHTPAPMGIDGEDGSLVVMGEIVSGDFFPTLGIEMARGRGFLPEEDRTPGSHPVVVISHRVWHDRFGSAEGIIGRSLDVNGRDFTIVGVAPDYFRGINVILTTDLWVPQMMVDAAYPYSVNLEGRIDPWMGLTARLRPGVTLEQAQAAVDAVAVELEAEFPDDNTGKTFTAIALDDNRIGSPLIGEGAARVTALMQAIVAVVLFVACFNVANLHLARCSSRQREIALRFSLGASRWRVLRQLLSESVILAALAGGVGLLVSIWGVDLLWALNGGSMFVLEPDLTIDVRVVGFTAAIAVLASVLFGLAPASRGARSDLFAGLRHHALIRASGSGSARLQRGLIVGQVALSVVVLVCAGMLVRSFQNLIAVDPGFELRRGLVATVNLGFAQYDEESGERFFHDITDDLRQLPGVGSVSIAAALPLGESHGHHDVSIEGYEPGPDEFMLFKRNMIDEEFLETMGIRVVRGRGFESGDTADSEPVALVNETMARRYWTDGDPIGKTLRADLGVARTVVGVIAGGKYGSRDEEPDSYLCIPMSQSTYLQRRHLVVAADVAPGSLLEPVRQRIAARGPGLPIEISTIDDYLGRSVGNVAGPALLASAFGLLALILATVGMYGVMSYVVSQRTHEFGVRIELGAKGNDVVGMVLGGGLRTTMTGIAVGLVLSVMATRAISGMLYGVATQDLAVLVLVASCLTAVALVACWVPARRAARVDPMHMLRAE